MSNGSGDIVTADGSTSRIKGVAISPISPTMVMCYQPNIVPGPSISGFMKSLALDIQLHKTPP